ncbi:MAG: hypothetical protein ACOC9Y_09055 [Chloroflexota bacterium]
MTSLLNYPGVPLPVLVLVSAAIAGLMLLAGCRTEANDPNQPAQPDPTPSPSATSPVTPTGPAVSPTPTGPATVPDSAADLPPVVLALRDDLATELDLPRSDVRVMSLREQQWSSTALGCPEPGRFYAQIVTGGYEVEILIGEETRLFHVSDDGRVVDCTNRIP